MSIAVGTKVRVRPGAIPWYGWNGVTPSSVGLVTHVKADGDCCVRFPECPKWLGRTGQLEPAVLALPRPRGFTLRRDVRIGEDAEFPADGWVAMPIRPSGSEAERTLFDGLVRMFTPAQPQHLHQGRDVREDCPPYDGIRPAAVWQISSESRNNLYYMQRESLKRRLRRSLPAASVSLHREETHLSQFHSLLPVDLDEEVNEVLLLHGTKPEHVQDILAHGLNERLCSGIFGHGTYLAEDVEKIDQYTEVDEELHTRGELRELHARLFGKDLCHPGSVYYAFVCRATLGQAIHTKDGRFSVDNGDLWANGPDVDIHELARIPGSNPCERHHSLIAELGNRITRFREFVIYHAGAQVLPEFLVAYHRTQDGVPIGVGYEKSQQQCAPQEQQGSVHEPRASVKAPETSAAFPHRHVRRRGKSRNVYSKAQALVAKIRLPEKPTNAGKDESVDELLRSSQRDAAMVLAAGGAARGSHLALAACHAMSPERKVPAAPTTTKARSKSKRVEVRKKSQGPDLLRRRSAVRRKSGSDLRRRGVEMPRLFCSGGDDLPDAVDDEFARLCTEALAEGHSGVGAAASSATPRSGHGSLCATPAAAAFVREALLSPEAPAMPALTAPGPRPPRQPTDLADIDDLLEELNGMLTSPLGGVPRIEGKAR